MWNPRKLNPGFSVDDISSLMRVCRILVFIGCSTRPNLASHSIVYCFIASTTYSSSCIITKSSAYLITWRLFLLSLLGNDLSPWGVLRGTLSIFSFRWFSSPCSVIFAKRGDITPPCGVPFSGNVHTSWLKIPAFSQADTCLFICGKVSSLLSKAWWFISSKHLVISASRTYFAFLFIPRCIASIAS